MPTGMLVGVLGPEYRVLLEGREVACTLRGRLKKVRQRVTAIAVIGDQVEVTTSAEGTGAIEAVLPRRSELSRPGLDGRTRILAANLDMLVVVHSARKPDFNRHLVERFLGAGKRGGVEGLVVVNKCDLEEPATIEAWIAPLVEQGFPVIRTAAKLGLGVEELRHALTGRVSALVGHSGVGKSTLLNALDPTLRARTAAVSATTGKGRHITSASRLYPLAGGGYLADTPGIRELALFEADTESLDEVFPEIAAAAPGCRFRGCSHSHEPGCAVKTAVERGEIDAGRYRHYLKLAAEEKQP
jgi:ribosome biogenesis GTPase / thiamine phosphate phosphatase